MKRSFKLNTGDLVTIGVFASLAEAGGLLIVFAGGGMNPLSMLLRNMFTVVLLSSLVVKVGKPWSLTLANITAMSVSALVMGQNMAVLPFIFMTSLIAEAFMWVSSRRYRLTLPLIIGVFLSEFMQKAVSFTYTYLRMREQPMADLIMGALAVIMSIAIIGSFLGIFVANRFIKELRRASLIFR